MIFCSVPEIAYALDTNAKENKAGTSRKSFIMKALFKGGN
jgi:hypothetical protein